MSITRSPFPPAQATERARWAEAALILAGHGSSSESGANTSLCGHAATLRARGIFAEVEAAALYGRPTPAQALAEVAADTVYIAPLFMCDGQFTRQAVPRAFNLQGLETRRGGRRFHLCPPLGLRPGLSDLILGRAAALARRKSLDPRDADLLLIGHGSPNDPASRRIAEWHAAQARAGGVFAAVRTAFLDEPPTLAEVLPDLRSPAVAVGLFAAEGLHAGDDIPRLLLQYGRAPLYYFGPIGADPAIPDLVLEQVAEADIRATSEMLAI
jgi:sirohydrochlorin cobaltochelatase